MPNHWDQSDDNVHTPIRWVVADLVSRDALIVETEDLHKQAYQEDKGLTWLLVETATPIWQNITLNKTIPTQIDNTDSPYTVLDDDTFIICDATSGAITVNLQALAAKNDGAHVAIQKSDSSANAVTITPNGSDTVMQDTSLVLEEQFDNPVLVGDLTNTNWPVGG